MIPEIFKDKIREMLGSEAEEFFASYDELPFAGLRVNNLKITTQEFEKISPFSLRSIPWAKNGFYYDTDNKPAKHPFYYAGLYYLQEPSAMSPGAILPIDEHDKVLDLCAAPGGKSTQLGDKLSRTGLLVSNDISPSRAKALLKNIEIFGIGNAVVTNEAPYALAQKFPEYFDKILVDAPCSGEGMFRKDKSVVKNYEQYGVEYYSKLQKEIILHAAAMLKPGGMMVYSTCTFSPMEDEGALKYLMDNVPEMEVVEIDLDCLSDANPSWVEGAHPSIKNAKRLWPHRLEGEGHFVALLRKKGEKAKNTCDSGKRNVKLPQEFEEFLKECDFQFDKTRFLINKDKIYYLPEYNFDTNGLRIMRNGLLMGELKTKRFEPSQALACFLKAQEYKNVISLKLEDSCVIKYLKGETLYLEDMVNPDVSKLKEGYCLVCVEGYSLGFAKHSNGTFKNKYLPGWRWM